MNNFLLPLAGAGTIVFYWYVCRVRSIAYREKAADLLTDYFNKNSVSEKDKDDAHKFYLMARSWTFLPLMTLIVFPVVLIQALARRPDSTPSQDRSAITDAIMKMYLSRNPITSIACLTIFSVAGLLAIFIGLLINRMRAIPSPSSAYMTAVHLARSVTWRHHA